MEKRREFLKTAGAFAAGSLVVPFGCSPKKTPEDTSEKTAVPPKNKDIGIQIYTLRNEIGRDGVESVMEKAAKAGYRWIEPYGYEDRKFLKKTPKEFKEMLSGLGMSAPSVHSVTEVSSAGGKDAIVDQMKTTAEDALTLGAEYLVWAYLKPEDRTGMDDYKRHVETWNKFGEVCKEAGIQFAYHNHDFEFMTFEGEAENPYEMIMRETDSDNVKFELDLYWVTKAKQDPVEWFKKDPGRFHLWHVKDMYPEDEHFAPVGKGKIDFRRIFDERNTSGMKYFFVEQDATREGVSPLDTMVTSWNYLNNADFV
ncbi:MAG: sugar phosphate isomerase/epimerase [Cytophagales bacterium]|nr:sugar phosphate isomerase/epimerase [Cytophagales bacterium]